MTSDDGERRERDHPDVQARVAQLETRVARLERLAWTAAELLLWLGLAAPLGVLLLTADRPSGLLWRKLFDASHLVVSAAIGLVALRLSRRLFGGELRVPLAHFLVAGTAVLVAGGGVEILQMIGPGDASWKDLVRDLMGGAAALMLALSVERTTIRSRPFRWALRVAAVALVAVGLMSAARVLVALGSRAHAFPVLAGFDSALESRFVTADDGADLAVVPAPAAFDSARGSVARVVFASGVYPKLEITDLVGDWSAYEALSFEIYSPQPAPVLVALRVHDRKAANRVSDRYDTELTVRPGTSTISIPVAEIRSGPRGRAMDLGRIESVILYVPRPSRPVTLYFDSFRLERGRAPE